MRIVPGSVAAVTGAASGIGRALALELAGLGVHLSLADRDGEGLAGTADAARARGVRVSTTTLDVADRDAVFAWAAATRDEHGRVDLVVNNAGVALSGTVRDLSVEDYRWIMDINFWGVVHGTQAFLPILEAGGGGHVVNLSSVFGLTAQPLMSGYNASKYAVRGFTESLRQELELTGSPVSCTCVHPGGIKTSIARSARMHASTAGVTGQDDAASSREFERTFITSPESAARQILRAVRRNRRRVLVGPDAVGYDVLVRVAPTGYQRVVTGVMRWRGAGRGTRPAAVPAGATGERS